MLQKDRMTGFRVLFDTYYMPLCLFSLQITDDFSASEDIVQSFFVSFWEDFMEKRMNGQLHSYLFVTIRNNSMAYMRKNNTMDSLILDNISFSNEMMIEMMEAEDRFEDMKTRENELYKALMALSPNEREALEHVVVDEKSYKQASIDMGISVNTLKTYLKRAMKKLREEQ